MNQTTKHTTLISADQLKQLAAGGQPFMVFDCSFDLMSPGAGEAMYLESHIPGAIHADLDKALSHQADAAAGANASDATRKADAPDASSGPASGGRHPLPSREKFAAWLGSIGFDTRMQAVVYDRQGANYCGRLWWMLKWVGHENVAVLDGGLQAWLATSGITSSGMEPAHPPLNYAPAPAITTLATTRQIEKNLGRPVQTLVDARGAPRFRGEVEPLDPVAGHIPGALNRPFSQNMGADGKFKPAAQLKAEFETLLAGRDPATVVHHCGSGVSAVPNILAMEIAGLGHTELYAGSWSEWCSDPSRPVAKG